MKFTLLACGLLAGLSACGQDKAPADPARPKAATAAAETYAGAGHDRLCLSGQRAAFITFAASGGPNCSVRGTVSGDTLVPDGDASCRIGLTRNGDTVRLGPAGPACAYYCAAPATFAGKTFVRMAKPQPVTDIAGDPLC